jgi:hypothetical protein
MFDVQRLAFGVAADIGSQIAEAIGESKTESVLPTS